MEHTHTVIQMPPALLTVLEEWVRKQTDVCLASTRFEGWRQLEVQGPSSG
jgi:hypothetical protein